MRSFRRALVAGNSGLGLQRFDCHRAPLPALAQTRAGAPAQAHRALRDSTRQASASGLGLLRPLSRPCRKTSARLRLRHGARLFAHALCGVHFLDETSRAAPLSLACLRFLRWLDAGDALRQHETGAPRPWRIASLVRGLRRAIRLCYQDPSRAAPAMGLDSKAVLRSEEHTSELQSHSFISYA